MQMKSASQKGLAFLCVALKLSLQMSLTLGSAWWHRRKHVIAMVLQTHDMLATHERHKGDAALRTSSCTGGMLLL